MANEKISNLDPADPLDGTEEFPIVQTGKPNTVKTTINAIATFFGYVKKGTITNNTILKGSGTDTATDSGISDDGTTVLINRNTEISSGKIIKSGTGQIDFYTNSGVALTSDNGAFVTPYLWTDNSVLDQAGVYDDVNLKFIGVSSQNEILSSLKGVHVYNNSTVVRDATKIKLDAPLVEVTQLTASQIVATDASKNLQTLSTATYPSLAELSYTKGVTSAIQTQLNSKKDHLTLYFLGGILSPADNTSYYFTRLSPTITETSQDISLGYNGKVVGAIIMAHGNTVSGSAENATIQFRNVTQGTSSVISSTVLTNGSSTNIVTQTVTGLSIDFLGTDTFTIQYDAPAYATNPANFNFTIYLTIEKTN